MARMTAGVRLAVAGVWLFQGVWGKVMRRWPEHEAVVAEVPFVGPARARVVTVAIGSGEAALAAWVLSRRAPVGAATVQTALLAGMNAGGLAFARERIPRPGWMVLRNAGFLAAVWAAAALGRSR